MEYIIRSANQNDLKACEKLLDSPEFYATNGDKWSVEWLTVYIDNDYFLVAEKENQVVGFIMTEKLKQNGSMLWFIVVETNFRNQGIGSSLLKQFEKNAKKANLGWIVLYATLYNEGTVKFYQKHNYSLGDKLQEGLKIL